MLTTRGMVTDSLNVWWQHNLCWNFTTNQYGGHSLDYLKPFACSAAKNNSVNIITIKRFPQLPLKAQLLSYFHASSYLSCQGDNKGTAQVMRTVTLQWLGVTVLPDRWATALRFSCAKMTKSSPLKQPAVMHLTFGRSSFLRQDHVRTKEKVILIFTSHILLRLWAYPLFDLLRVMVNCTNSTCS